MKFNLEKWEAMLNKKQAMYDHYRLISEDRLHARDVYLGQLNVFTENYGRDRRGPEMLNVLKKDKRLPAHELKSRIDTIFNQWSSVCDEFFLKPDTPARLPLQELYKHLLAWRKL